MSAASNVSTTKQQTIEQLLKTMQALKLQNQVSSTSSSAASNSVSGPVAADSSIKKAKGLERLLTAAEIKDVQYQAKALVVTCNVWWDKFLPFGYPRVESAAELACYREELKELNKLDTTKRKLVLNWSSKKVDAERQISLLWIVKALYRVIPEKFHDMLESGYSGMENMMKAAAGGLRSTMMHHIRQSASTIFEDIPVPHTVFHPGYAQGSNELCLSLLGYDEVRQRYKQCPKVLYPVGEGDEASVSLFRSPAMVKVLSLILYGLSSLRAGKMIRSTNGTLWKIFAITPGTIACAAIILCYLLTSDGNFLEEGDKTGIPYSQDCDYYIRIIETTISLPSTQRTIDFFNQNLFTRRRTGAGLVISEAGKDSDSEEEEILRALHQPEADQETEVNTSLEDDRENNMSATLMPLLTLRAVRFADPPATGHNYVEIHSDDEPHPTNIFATSSDDEPITAITADALGHRSSLVGRNRGTEQGNASGMGSNASDNPLPAAVNAPKPNRGRGRGGKKFT
ncbi:uncharacterized protein EV420DRAFT_1639124 [Desarmillaria tabescens]|uniref:Uncharacterized protein n=1 Tax=Armillaria tabescens TaxID=1929756 RepID=A0AA39NCJ2_ARMTA|nr:uncharacterized protein EV420DRAFT_1639124 [Desarmillaria tabescens]KAK0463039.1 hypothetical protein EV420DRAFT_1639124 [Desarmillaria tabescens]